MVKIFVFLCLLIPVVAHTKDTPSEAKKDIPILDDTHQIVSERLVQLANRLDSFFADKRADDEFNRSSIRLTYSYRLRMEKKPLDDFQFRFNLRLPSLEDKFRFSVQKNESKKDSDKKSVPLTTTPVPEKVSAKEPWRFRADAGLNVSYPPIVFTRARLRKNWRFPFLIQRFTEELSWISDQGLLQNTTLYHDHDLKESLLFRFTNEQDWFINDKKFSTSHGPSLIQTLTDNDALSYNLRAQSRIKDSWYIHNYSLGILYRRNLRNQWLYGEIGPTLDFPKSDSFRRAPSILLRIESLFGAR